MGRGEGGQRGFGGGGGDGWTLVEEAVALRATRGEGREAA